MAVYTSRDALITAIGKKMQSAMSELKAKSEQETKNELQSFYSQGEPTIYKRTGKLGRSMKSVVTANGIVVSSFVIWLDQTYGYKMPNKAFTEKGYSSYFSTPMVLAAAEAGTAHIKGRPGFWARSVQKIESDMNSIFSKYFNS